MDNQISVADMLNFSQTPKKTETSDHIDFGVGLMVNKKKKRNKVPDLVEPGSVTKNTYRDHEPVKKLTEQDVNEYILKKISEILYSEETYDTVLDDAKNNSIHDTLIRNLTKITKQFLMNSLRDEDRLC